MTGDSEKSDKEIIIRIKKGDHTAFKMFFNFYQPEIFRFLYRLLINYNIAQDITQDTFIKFWDARTRIDEQNNPKAYLFITARNLAFNYLQREKKLSSIDEKNSKVLKLPDNSINHDLLEEEVKNAVMLLPDRCREIIILSKYHNFKIKEIAEMLNISEQTVKNQINKSFSTLRKNLLPFRNL